jgi:hypothetical protein
LNGVKIYRRVVGKTGNSAGAGGGGRIIETEGNKSENTCTPSTRKEFSDHGACESNQSSETPNLVVG